MLDMYRCWLSDVGGSYCLYIVEFSTIAKMKGMGRWWDVNSTIHHSPIIRSFFHACNCVSVRPNNEYETIQHYISYIHHPNCIRCIKFDMGLSKLNNSSGQHCMSFHGLQLVWYLTLSVATRSNYNIFSVDNYIHPISSCRMYRPN